MRPDTLEQPFERFSRNNVLPSSPSPRTALAISGGGDNGAFGAGLLTAWSKHGDRPQFDEVTGVSAGALIAPFAFLGPEYDDTLQHLWTSLDGRNLVRVHSIPRIISGGALLNIAPLRQLIDEYITPDFVAAIAREHAHGRRLYVGTTDLDAGEFVVWDMGAIASGTGDKAVDLFRRILRGQLPSPACFRRC